MTDAPDLAELERRAAERGPAYGEGAHIVCDNLVRIYKTDGVEVVALQGLDLLVDPGELVAIVGASGSGKSTLLNILSGLDVPTVVVTHDPQISEHVDRTVGIRDGRTSSEVRRRAGDDGSRTAEEYAVLDRAGRVQLPAAFTEALDMRERVRLNLESDHVGVWPDRKERE